MKKASIYIGLGLALLLASCKKGKDLFTSPNNPTQATVQTMLTSIEVATMNTYEGDLNRTSSLFIQHNVGVDGQYLQVQQYFLDESEFNNQWAQIYQTLLTCKLLNENYKAENPYYAGINEIMMAMNWGVLADYWGDVPYSEALLGDANYTPKYDPQQMVISSGVLDMLDDAIAQLGKAASDNAQLPGADDVIFGGKVAKWIKTAYTLKARYLNRFSNKGTYDPAAVLTALSQGIQSSADNCMAIHGTGGNEQNQWYGFLNQGRIYMGASIVLLDSMMLRPQDERVYYYYDSTGGTITGSPIDVPDQNASLLGPYLAAASETPTPLVTIAEVKFIEAEVKARQNDPTAAQALNDGIKESCLMVTGGVYNGSNIATYTAANTTLDRIMYEKWIANFGLMEAYNDYRRTKLPALTPNPKGTIPVIPQRYPTPQTERISNPNAPVPSIQTPVWWAQ